MNTLQEFIAYTKGWEYIIAISFIALFVVFWQLWSRGAPAEDRRHVKEEAAGQFATLAQGWESTADPVLQQPLCWQVKNCSVEDRRACPAFGNGNTACWQAKQLARGWTEADKACLACQLYRQVVAVSGS